MSQSNNEKGMPLTAQVSLPRQNAVGWDQNSPQPMGQPPPYPMPANNTGQQSYPPPYPVSNAGQQPMPYPQGRQENMPNDGSQPVEYGEEVERPPIGSFDSIDGYENTIGEDSVPVGPPPSYEQVQDPNDIPQQTFLSATTLTAEEAKDALVEYVSHKSCYGKSAATQMKIKNMETTSAFHYCLETFHETRETSWQNEPYQGQPIDGPQNGTAPSPWQVVVRTHDPFVEGVEHVEVPHSASVKRCWGCRGLGSTRCVHCHGRGKDQCISCSGSGFTGMSDSRSTCTFCHGSGQRRCISCHGYGYSKCRTCQGCCQLKAFIRLTVSWKTLKSDHVLERTDLPDHLIQSVQGVEIFNQQYPRVYPLTSFPEDEINRMSKQFLETHGTQLQTAHVLMQRHNLRAVPVNEIEAEYKQDKVYRFWVYGNENKIYCADYPQKFCCGCQIL